MRRSTSEPLRIWDLPATEHAAWVAAGFGRCTWEQYRARIARAMNRARRNRRPVALLAVSVSRMLVELDGLGLAPTPLGIDMALRAIHAGQARQHAPLGTLPPSSARTLSPAPGLRARPRLRVVDQDVLWVFPRADHDVWLLCGLGTAGYVAYLRQLSGRYRQALRHGRRLTVVRARVFEVLGELSRAQEPHASDVEQALRRLLWRRERATIVPELTG
jgi:hypothetical protein